MFVQTTGISYQSCVRAGRPSGIAIGFFLLKVKRMLSMIESICPFICLHHFKAPAKTKKH